MGRTRKHPNCRARSCPTALHQTSYAKPAALRGHPLRQEIYALDNSADGGNPYTTLEYRYQVDKLQPFAATSYGSYYPWQREALSCHYERNPADPRISHELTLTIDPYGNITSRARRLPTAHPAFPEQSTTWVSTARPTTPT